MAENGGDTGETAGDGRVERQSDGPMASRTQIENARWLRNTARLFGDDARPGDTIGTGGLTFCAYKNGDGSTVWRSLTPAAETLEEYCEGMAFTTYPPCKICDASAGRLNVRGAQCACSISCDECGATTAWSSCGIAEQNWYQGNVKRPAVPKAAMPARMESFKENAKVIRMGKSHILETVRDIQRLRLETERGKLVRMRTEAGLRIAMIEAELANMDEEEK